MSRKYAKKGVKRKKLMVHWINMLMSTHKNLVKQMLLYGVIGGGSSLVDTVCYIAMTRYLLLGTLLANFISVNIGITCSFLLNTYFNFRQTSKLGKRAISFFLVGYCGLGLSSIMLFIGTNLIHINDIVVKVIAIFFVAAFQFVLNKLITYSKI